MPVLTVDTDDPLAVVTVRVVEYPWLEMWSCGCIAGPCGVCTAMANI